MAISFYGDDEYNNSQWQSRLKQAANQKEDHFDLTN